MTPEPAMLLDTSIAQLRTLVSFLAEQMGTVAEQERSSPETLACKEILLSIRALLPRVQQVAMDMPAEAELHYARRA